MAENIGSDDNEKSLYLIQIQYLEEQLERCQLRCDELEKQNKDITSQYNALEKDKKDITDYLKRSVGAKEKKVDELVKRLESQQAVAEQAREDLNLQYNQQKQKLQEEVNSLNSESIMQVAKIEEQKEQLMQLRDQLQYLKTLEKQLVSRKEQYEADIRCLEMEAELERAKISKDMENTVDDSVKMKLADILQKERAQHSKRVEQLEFLQSENMPLQKQKDILQDRDRDLCVQRDSLKKDLNKIIKESITYKKEVEQLSEKCKQLKMELKGWSITHEHVLAQIEALSQLLASVSEERCQKTAEVDQLGAELQKERSRKRQLEGVMQEAAIILRHILMDLEKVSETEWKVQRLLEILESTAHQETGWTLSDFTDKSIQGEKPQTSGPRPGRKLCSQKTSSYVDPYDPAPHLAD